MQFTVIAESRCLEETLKCSLSLILIAERTESFVLLSNKARSSYRRGELSLSYIHLHSLNCLVWSKNWQLNKRDNKDPFIVVVFVCNVVGYLKHFICCPGFISLLFPFSIPILPQRYINPPHPPTTTTSAFSHSHNEPRRQYTLPIL